MSRNPNLHVAARAVAIPSPIVTQYMKNCVKAAGGDPASVPELPYKFLRPAAIAEMIGVSLATLRNPLTEAQHPAGTLSTGGCPFF